MLHAVVVGVLLRTARGAKDSEDVAKARPSQLLTYVRRDMEHAMKNRRRRLKRENKGGLFEQRWREVCDVGAAHLRCTALDDPADVRCGKPPPVRRLYVDGSMRQGGQRKERINDDAEAGWSVVTVKLAAGAYCGNFDAGRETVTAALAGRVSLEVGSGDYRGATVKSNNTGELTALLRAVEEELQRDHRPVEICADSLYALGQATGKWKPPRKRNVELVRRLQERVRALTLQRGKRGVTLSHVRAHARTPGNEAADALAKEAARDATVSRDAAQAFTLAHSVHPAPAGARRKPASQTSATSADTRER